MTVSVLLLLQIMPQLLLPFRFSRVVVVVVVVVVVRSFALTNGYCGFRNAELEP